MAFFVWENTAVRGGFREKTKKVDKIKERRDGWEKQEK